MSNDPHPSPDVQLEAAAPPSACTGGLCTSQACKNAEHLDLARGCRFYALQMDNVDSDDGKKMMLVLTNGSDYPTTVAIESRAADGWNLVAPQDVIPPWETMRFELSRPTVAAGWGMYAALRVTTDRPVLAVQIISDDADRMSSSSSGTVLPPVQALGTSYMALTYPQVNSAVVAATAGSRDGAGMITIVSTADATDVVLHPTTTTLVAAGVPFVPGMVTNEFDATLNEGDVLQVFSDLPGGDLSGTTIDATHAVEVFSGNVFTTYGNEPRMFNGGDMAVEALPPLAAWSSDYVGARLSPQGDCDGYFGPGGGQWQVLAAQEATMITVSPSPGTDLIVDNSTFTQPTMFQLHKGESRLFTTTPDPTWPPTSPAPTGDVVVTADGPILVGQWLDCEPGLSLGMDTRFGTLTDMSFAFPPGFDQQVVIARHVGVPVQFDGETIPNEYFRPASTGNDFEVARLTAGQFGDCRDEVDTRPCQHRVTSPTMGVALGWRGVDIVCSYALTVPPSNPCVMPGCVQ